MTVKLITKPMSVADYAKLRRRNAKVIRRQLRSMFKHTPQNGWRVTPAIDKRLVA